MSEERENIDWESVTFAGAEREQLQKWSQLPLRDKLLAVEQMSEHARATITWRRARGLPYFDPITSALVREGDDNHSVRDLSLAFDVGHSSIGWAVLQNNDGNTPELVGCGAVIFPADDCLASQRRAFRRQRRHIRATRQRIERMKLLLEHLGVLTREQLDRPGCAWPWLLAARVLRGGKLLSWPELWDVLRWYAHNRGYDANKRWSANDAAADAEDTEKVEKARALYIEHGTGTMAETFCAISGLDPLGHKRSAALAGDRRPKAMNAAFPREDVEAEVRAILEKHRAVLPNLGDAFTSALFENWRAIPCEDLKLPKRFHGGLLFGQLVPRFENRIIARCPITFERVFQQQIAKGCDPERAKHEAEKQAKVPAKECREFYEFRWATQLANVMVATNGAGTSSRLIENESWRRTVDSKMRERGYLTPGEFKKAVREATGGAPDNLDQMLLHPDAQKALVLDPAKKLVSTNKLIALLWPLLPERNRKRAFGKWRRGKSITVVHLLDHFPTGAQQAVDDALAKFVDAQNTKRSKRDNTTSREELLRESLKVERLDGRAPYHRAILREAVADVLERGLHPTEQRDRQHGVLFRSETIRDAQLQRAIDEQTNNHLVRHRLRILERLNDDLVKEYAGGDKARIGRITIEVNRDLREQSGKSRKEQEMDLGRRLANFKGVAARLEKAFAGKEIDVTPGLIRKARVAEDLGWHCPYTGKGFDEFDLLYRKVDKDHIVPRNLRPSDSLDSLVITFAEINKWKGNRTALRFIEEEQGKTVPGLPNLSIKPLATYQKDVEALETFKGHADDQRRKKNRKRFLLLRDYIEKEFIPSDLTQTSQLVRLGAQTLQKQYAGCANLPVITSLPGSVTGAVRKSWDLSGCLSAANPLVLDQNGDVRTKTEIRDITHLHHALDACVLALARHFIGRDGGIWQLLVKRRLNGEERDRLSSRLRDRVEFTQTGQLRLTDLPSGLKDQVRQRLAERRVVQHIPASMDGLHAEQNTWRVVRIENGEALLRQRIRQPDGSRRLKEAKEKTGKLLGLHPDGGLGKLRVNKGALVIPDNYGVALDPEPVIIPFHKVWPRIQELKKSNGGKESRIIRNGQLIEIPRGKFQGTWKVFSVKNNASGMALDIGKPDVTRLRNKTEGHKINVLLASLIRDGLQPLETPLIGRRG